MIYSSHKLYFTLVTSSHIATMKFVSTLRLVNSAKTCRDLTVIQLVQACMPFLCKNMLAVKLMQDVMCYDNSSVMKSHK